MQAASYVVNLIPEKGHQSLVYGSHHILGVIYHSNGVRENAINHFEVALRIASAFNWHVYLFWMHRVGLKRPDLRLYMGPSFLRNLGQQRTWRTVEDSFRIYRRN